MNYFLILFNGLSVIKRNFVLSLLITFLCFSSSLQALNGLLLYGIGPRNRAMGGANAAFPVDASTIIINPAGIGRLGKSADIGAHLLRARRTVDTGNVTTGFANTAAGEQDSTQKYYLTLFCGMSHGDESSPLAIGALIAGDAGEGAKYCLPIINPDELLVQNGSTNVTETGDIYDTSTFLFIVKAIIGASYDLNCGLSLGAGFHVNQALFSSDIAKSTPDGIFETQARGRLDIAHGLGASLGVLYDLDCGLSIGATYTSRQWFEDFGRYIDVLPNFRLPTQVRVGLAYTPFCDLVVTADYKWIGWQTVSLFDNQPTEGGFGWKDQHTVGVGVQYKPLSLLTGRLGFNYGRSPIRSEVVFANALIPAIYQSHLAAGVEIHLGSHNSIAINVVHTFLHSETDNGQGDLFSQLGKGTIMRYHAWDIDAAWRITF